MHRDRAPDSSSSGGPGSWATLRRAGQLLDWSSVDKAILFAIVPIPFLVLAWFRLRYLLAHPAVEPYVHRPTAALVYHGVCAYFGLLAVLLVGWWRLRSRAPEHRGFVLTTLTLWFFAMGLAADVIGSMSSPVLIGFMAGAMSALALFEIPTATIAIAVGVATVFAPLPFVAAGVLPYGPFYSEPPFIAGRPSADWVALTSIYSIAILVVPLALLASVLHRWRLRDAEIHRMARFDVLTELANRRHFLERLGEELERARRFGSPVGFLLLDLDHFKAINDTHGHLVGDRVLVHVSRLLAERALRRVDVIGRWGGEELAVFLPSTDLEGARVVAERCRSMIESSPLDIPGKGPISVTASLGCVVYRGESGVDVDDLVRRADDALYRAKNAGRNRVDATAIAS